MESGKWRTIEDAGECRSAELLCFRAASGEIGQVSAGREAGVWVIQAGVLGVAVLIRR